MTGDTPAPPEGSAAGSRTASVSLDSLEGLFAAAMVFALYWVPALVGGDYSRGDFEMTHVRLGAASLLTLSLPVCVWIACRCKVRRWFPAALVLFGSAGLVNFGLAVSAAWVHVPPFSVLLVAFLVAGAPTFLLPFVKRGAWLVLGCAAASTALSSFWMAFFHPYL